MNNTTEAADTRRDIGPSTHRADRDGTPNDRGSLSALLFDLPADADIAAAIDQYCWGERAVDWHAILDQSAWRAYSRAQSALVAVIEAWRLSEYRREQSGGS